MSPPEGATTPQPSAGDAPILDTDDLVGRTISGRYRIESILGEGGMGAVYLAEHTLMHKRLAVKVLHPEMTRLPEVVARFEREAMAAAHIEHPNVASATDFGKLDDGSFFLVLEYVEGLSLRDAVYAGPLELPRALHIARQIASALARAHGLGIVHRDLKPENVMLVERDGDKDFVKVLDFGIAKVPVGQLAKAEGQAKALTQVGMVYGTPEYMAPEQALGQEVDARADLYALGVMLYEMLAGVRPFDAESKVTLLGMQVTQTPPRIATKAPEVSVPAPIEALVMKLLDKEASGRYQDAREVIDAIDGALVDAGYAYVAPPSVRGSSPSMRLRAASPIDAPPPPPASIAPPNGSPPGSQKLVAAASAFKERLPSSFDSLRAKLPPAIANAPPVALLAAGGSALLVVLVVLIVAFRGRGPVVHASADGGAPVITHGSIFETKPTKASADELAAATTPDALEQLATKYPEDADVLRALVRADASQKKHVEAMDAVKKLVTLDPKAADETEIGQAVMFAAQGAPEAADAAFTLMEGLLGARGADLLYELYTATGVAPKTVTRLRQALARQEVRAHATPALLVALEIRDAKTCDAKHALLGKAKADGDARTLGLIKPLGAAKGCGFLGLRECWPCMRRDKALAQAIEAIEQRMSAGAK